MLYTIVWEEVRTTLSQEQTFYPANVNATWKPIVWRSIALEIDSGCRIQRIMSSDPMDYLRLDAGCPGGFLP